jgi:hypothetical protein
MILAPPRATPRQAHAYHPQSSAAGNQVTSFRANRQHGLELLVVVIIDQRLELAREQRSFEEEHGQYTPLA